MLILYFLGQLFIQFLGERKLWSVYVSGGLAGALLYILFYNVFPAYNDINGLNAGASAAIMSIVVAIGTYRPNLSVKPFGLFSVQLKYVVAILFVVDYVNIASTNSGGHVAHIGGGLLGFFFARQWLKGRDITSWVNKPSDFILALFKGSKRSKMKVKYKRPVDDYDYNSRKKNEQEDVDRILEKISRSGYDSLSKKEKEILFRASNKS